MNNKEINLRSIIFLFIGIVLIVSLIICVYIISSERDLVHTKGEVTKVNIDSNNKGDNDVTVSYVVDGKTYNYNFYYSEDIKEKDTIDIYYHKEDVTSVQTYKTSYFIFVCPLFGLLLCVLGLIETFRKKDEDDEDLYETKVLHITDTTQQLGIVTGDEEVKYEKLPEEAVEPEVGTIKKDSPIKDVKKNKKNSRVIPVYYYLSKESIVYELKNKDKLEEVKVNDIEKITRVMDGNRLVKIIVLAKENEYHLGNVKNVNLPRFEDFLLKKMVSIKKDFKEDIINK